MSDNQQITHYNGLHEDDCINLLHRPIDDDDDYDDDDDDDMATTVYNYYPDWLAVRTIYGEGDMELEEEEMEEQQQQQQQQQQQHQVEANNNSINCKTTTTTKKKVGRLQESWVYYDDDDKYDYERVNGGVETCNGEKSDFHATTKNRQQDAENDEETNVIDDDETVNSNNNNNDNGLQRLRPRPQRRRRLFFCGTIVIVASDQTFRTQIAFARRVTNDVRCGEYRYFCLARPPSVRVQLLYRPHHSNGDDDDDYYEDNNNDNDNDNHNENDDSYGPIQVRVQWDYYPIEWPQCDKENFCTCLQRECDKLISQSHPTTGFDICEFLEHHMIESYGRYQQQQEQHDGAGGSGAGGGGVRYWRRLQSNSKTTQHKTMQNDEEQDEQQQQENNDNSDNDDRYNPNGYQLYILPPEHDKLYQENYGTLINPRKEAAIVAQTVRKTNILKRLDSKPKKSKSTTLTMKRSLSTTAHSAAAAATTTTMTTTMIKTTKLERTTATRSTRTSVVDRTPPPLYAQANNVLEFAKLALIEHWKQLYTTTCPICFDDDVLFEDGITFKKCQHYCCHECFRTYLTYKVNDLSQHRTNPFLCPVETCSDRELPFATICRRYLGPQEQRKVAEWYRDLTFPPCWSLDRCLNVKECGAIGSMRRKAMPPKKKTPASSSSSSSLPTRGISRQTNHYNNNYNYHREEEPLAVMGGFFHHGVLFPADQEREAKKRQEKQIQDEIKRRTQVNALSTSSSSLICCEECNTTWCELCLQRVPSGHEHAHYDRRGSSTTTSSDGTVDDSNRTGDSNGTRPNRCQPQAALTFSRQYLEASEEKQEETRRKFPWIVSYALFCQHDGAAVEYLQESGGQRCPNCRAGVERIEGCFHMKCPTCATHFCYECGEELFPPYYGTHHCWEDVGNIVAADAQDARELAQRQRQNRLDEELATRLMLEEALGDELPNFDL